MNLPLSCCESKLKRSSSWLSVLIIMVEINKSFNLAHKFVALRSELCVKKEYYFVLSSASVMLLFRLSIENMFANYLQQVLQPIKIDHEKPYKGVNRPYRRPQKCQVQLNSVISVLIYLYGKVKKDKLALFQKVKCFIYKTYTCVRWHRRVATGITPSVEKFNFNINYKHWKCF